MPKQGQRVGYYLQVRSKYPIKGSKNRLIIHTVSFLFIINFLDESLLISSTITFSLQAYNYTTQSEQNNQNKNFLYILVLQHFSYLTVRGIISHILHKRDFAQPSYRRHCQSSL